MNPHARCLAAAALARLLLATVAGAASDAGSAPPLPLLTTTAQVHALSAEEAQKGYPVRLRAVVSFYDQPHFDTCFVCDETGGLSVLTPGLRLRLNVGDAVELRGVSDPGRFAPTVRALEITPLGQGSLPEPKRVTFEEAATGNEDAQWVEFAGTVRAVTVDERAARLVIEMATGGGRLMARVRDYDPRADYSGLVDSRVRIRGVCVQLFNEKRQMFDARLLTPGMSDVSIDEPAPPDPFAVPARPITTLLQYTPDGIYGRRVHVQGVVTHQQSGRALFVRDETQSLLINTAGALAVQPGDRVDAAGFPAVGEWAPIMQDATYRRIGPGPAPLPAAVTAEQALSGAHDAGLVRIEGAVIEHAMRRAEEILVLQAGPLVFDATLDTPPGAGESLSFARPGSWVQLTGICLVNVGKQRAPQSFRLLLRSPADVAVLRQPSWWTLRRLLWSLAGVSSATLAGWIWVAALGRRVRRQTGIIREKIEREAALEERARLAREFHDTLEQQLTGIRLQLDAVKTKFKESPAEAESYLDVARSLIRHSHAEAKRSVWDLRADLLEANGLPAALSQALALSASASPLRPRVRVSGAPRRLPGTVENHLLRIGQEAVTNALKHAGAGEVRVELSYGADSVRLRVEDDGKGFDGLDPAPAGAGHFGLVGMRERAEKIGASLRIASAPGRGTTVEVALPAGAPPSPAHAT